MRVEIAGSGGLPLWPLDGRPSLRVVGPIGTGTTHGFRRSLSVMSRTIMVIGFTSGTTGTGPRP